MRHLKNFKNFNQDEKFINEAKFINFIKDGVRKSLDLIQRGLGIDKESKERKQADKEMQNKDNFEKVKFEIEEIISKNAAKYKEYIEGIYFLNGKDMTLEIDYKLKNLVDKNFSVPEIFLFNEFTTLKFGKNFGHLIRKMFNEDFISLCIEQLVLARTKVKKKTDTLSSGMLSYDSGKRLTKGDRPDEKDCEIYASKFKIPYDAEYDLTTLGKFISGASKLFGNRCYDEI